MYKIFDQNQEKSFNVTAEEYDWLYCLFMIKEKSGTIFVSDRYDIEDIIEEINEYRGH